MQHCNLTTEVLFSGYHQIAYTASVFIGYHDNEHLSVFGGILAWNLRMSRGFPAFLRQF